MASTGPDTVPSDKKPPASRVNSHDAPPSRKASGSLQMPKRAHTFHNDNASSSARPPEGLDAFETSQDADENDNAGDNARKSVDLDELPIELITLTDR